MIPNSNEPQPRDDGDPLHHLLREAQWPQPIQDAEARLTQRWRDAWSARRRREMLTRRAAALAVAASLLVAAAVGYGWLHRADKLVARPEPAPESALKTGRNSNSGSGSGAPIDEKVGSTHIVRRLTSPSPGTEASPSRIAARNVPSPEESDGLAFSRPPKKFEEMMIAALDRRRERRMGALRTARSQSALQEKSPSKSSRVQVAASKGPPAFPFKRRNAKGGRRCRAGRRRSRRCPPGRRSESRRGRRRHGSALGTVGVRMAARLGRDQRPSRRANRGHAAFGRNWEPCRSPLSVTGPRRFEITRGSDRRPVTTGRLADDQRARAAGDREGFCNAPCWQACWPAATPRLSANT